MKKSCSSRQPGPQQNSFCYFCGTEPVAGTGWGGTDRPSPGQGRPRPAPRPAFQPQYTVESAPYCIHTRLQGSKPRAAGQQSFILVGRGRVALGDSQFCAVQGAATPSHGGQDGMMALQQYRLCRRGSAEHIEDRSLSIKLTKSY